MYIYFIGADSLYARLLCRAYVSTRVYQYTRLLLGVLFYSTIPPKCMYCFLRLVLPNVIKVMTNQSAMNRKEVKVVKPKKKLKQKKLGVSLRNFSRITSQIIIILHALLTSLKNEHR